MASNGPGGTTAVVGGGFSGTLLALKLAKARPDRRIVLIEPNIPAGRGLAYGACAPYHLLNVPVSRMEVGLEPRFDDWLAGRAGTVAEALDEAGGDLHAAFVQRAQLGDYMEEQLGQSRRIEGDTGLFVVNGEAVRMLDGPRRGVQLSDGREVEADRVVLATGNLPPRPPLPNDHWLRDSAAFAADPWARGALEGIAHDAPVVLLGTGLTMVDIALRLADEGHTGPIYAVSRRGLLPTSHRYGGDWQPFLGPLLPASPLKLMRAIRAEAAIAQAKSQPWQRVVDAVRPLIARIWTSWSYREKRQFLRHLRPRWDVHRHRMAPRIGQGIEAMVASGQLRIMAGRSRYHHAGDRVEVQVTPRGGGETVSILAARIINCTGPRSDLDGLAVPLFADLTRRGLIRPDALGLGLESDDCAVIDASGRASDWLYALGPLTRPAWWEVTAVPEITAQVDRLVDHLAADPAPVPHPPSLAEVFIDLGAGI